MNVCPEGHAMPGGRGLTHKKKIPYVSAEYRSLYTDLDAGAGNVASDADNQL